MVGTVRLALARANFDIVRETSLSRNQSVLILSRPFQIFYALTRIAECRARAISLSCSKRGLLPRISGSQNWPTAPFMWPILPCSGAGALTHCEGSRPTPQTMYAWVRVFGVRWAGLRLRVEGIGCVIRECSDEVRLGTTSEFSPSPRVVGRSRVDGRTKDEWSRRDGPIVAVVPCILRLYIEGRLDRSRRPHLNNGRETLFFFFGRHYSTENRERQTGKEGKKQVELVQTRSLQEGGEGLGGERIGGSELNPKGDRVRLVPHLGSVR